MLPLVYVSNCAAVVAGMISQATASQPKSIHSAEYGHRIYGEESVVRSPPRLYSMHWLYQDCLQCVPLAVWSMNKNVQSMMFKSTFSSEIMNMIIQHDWDEVVLLPSSANARAKAEKPCDPLPDLQYQAIKKQLLKLAQRDRLSFWNLSDEELRRSQEQSHAWNQEEKSGGEVQRVPERGPSHSWCCLLPPCVYLRGLL